MVLFDLMIDLFPEHVTYFFQRKRVSLKELENEDFIGYSEESFPGRNKTIINACGVAGFRPDLHYQADSLVEVLAMIGAGAGVCLMPSDVASLPHSGALFVPIREKLEPIRFTAAWRKENNGVVGELIGILRKLKACSGA